MNETKNSHFFNCAHSAYNMKKLYDMVRANDELVFIVLEKQSLKPEFFAFRWITLLLSQDFKLPGTPVSLDVDLFYLKQL